MNDSRDLITLYTAAPLAYDGFSTTTLRVVGRDNRRGEPIREVSIEKRDYEWQTTRYDSGGCSYTDERRTLDGYTRLGDWTLTKDASMQPAQK